MLVLLGDNPASGYDSRRAGYFDASTMLGVAVRTLGRPGPARHGCWSR